MTHYTGLFYGTLWELNDLINKIQYQMKGDVRILVPLDLRFPKEVKIEELPLPSPNNQIAHAFNKIPLQRQIFKLLSFATQRRVPLYGWGKIESYHDTRHAITTTSPQLTIFAKKETIHSSGKKT